jgi:hypothetical protein
MFYLLSVIGAFILGAISGILVYRNNATKLKAAEDKGKTILDALKGK